MKKIIVPLFCLWTSVSVFSYTDLNYDIQGNPVAEYILYLLQTTSLSLPKLVLSDY